MKISTFIGVLTIITFTYGVLAQAAVLGLVPTLLCATALFYIAEILEERL